MKITVLNKEWFMIHTYESYGLDSAIEMVKRSNHNQKKAKRLELSRVGLIQSALMVMNIIQKFINWKE